MNGSENVPKLVKEVVRCNCFAHRCILVTGVNPHLQQIIVFCDDKRFVGVPRRIDTAERWEIKSIECERTCFVFYKEKIRLGRGRLFG
jgi:hypothetical protein